MEATLAEKKNQRVVTFLNREGVDFLDKLGKDALFSTGLKVSRAKLIAWIVDLLKGLGITGENIKSERDFEVRVLEVLGQRQPHQPREARSPAVNSPAGLMPGGPWGGEK
jgi:hypothetical protein